MKIAVTLCAVLLALGLIACGGDDGDGEGSGLDVAALESCLDDDSTSTLERDTSGIDDVPTQPTDGWELTPEDAEALPVPSYVMVFPDEEAADAGVADIKGNSLAIVGEAGTVRWVIVKSDGGYAEDLDATISDCVDQAS